MKVKDFDELENRLNEIAWNLDKIESLSRILIDCIRGGDNLKSKDVENLTSVLDEKIILLKEKFNLIEQNFII